MAEMQGYIDAIRMLLRDPVDGPAPRWADTDLELVVAQAVARYSWALPRTYQVTLPTEEGVYRYEIGENLLGNTLIAVRSIEYPAGNHPPTLIPFSVEVLDVVFHIADPIPAGVDFVVSLDVLHQLTFATSTIPDAHEPMLQHAAAGYAAEMWAANSINRINASADTYRQYSQLAAEHIALFHRELKAIRRQRNHLAPSTVALTGYTI